ncbi:hypothetical protein OG589_12845 [Sphaerisporangium sp. NBC_01403]
MSTATIKAPDSAPPPRRWMALGTVATGQTSTFNHNARRFL